MEYGGIEISLLLVQSLIPEILKMPPMHTRMHFIVFLNKSVI